MEKNYHGVKFRTEFINRDISIDARVEELKFWCSEFHEKDLTQPYIGTSYGNLSFRLKENVNQFIITASNVGLKNKLSDDCFVKVVECDLKNKVIYSEGIKEPSSESMLHYAIYNQRKDINAIFHGHSYKILSNAEKLKIPTTEKEEEYGTIELVNRVLNLSQNNNFLIMKNHGFVSIGKDMKNAGELALEMRMKSL